MGIEKLAIATAKRAWTTIIIWILLVGLSVFLIARYLATGLTTQQSISTAVESQKVQEILTERLAQAENTGEIVIIESEKYLFTDPQFRDFTLNLQKQISELGTETVLSTVSYYQTNNRALVSEEGKIVLIIASLPGEMSLVQDKVEKVSQVLDKNDKADFDVSHTGLGSVNKDFQEVSESDLTKAEIIGLPIALGILIFVFGALVAAVLPLILSFLSIIIALAASAVLGQIFNLSFFVTNIITMMGLAVGIDYALFIISRFREERAYGVDKVEAIRNSAKTAGKAIFFSGITVVIALSGLLFVPSNIFRSLAIGAIFVVVAAVLAAITLLPALLSLLGDRVNWLSLPLVGGRPIKDGHTKGFWNFISSGVMRWAWLALPTATGLLIWASIPLSAIKIGQSGVSSLPEGTSSRAGFEILESKFSPGLFSPTPIVIDGNLNDSQIQSAVGSFENALRAKPTVAAVTSEAVADQNLTALNVALAVGDEEAVVTIKEIREEIIPSIFKNTRAEAYVGGQTAQNLDFTKIVEDYTPLVFGFVLTLSFILLMIVFRSLIVPIKAIFLNLLSVGAAYGLLVLVFQYGVGNELLGFQRADQIEMWIPLFLFAILFGLSMDYHVFLLSRIRERFNKTKNNTEAVAFGLSTTGRLITGAALIMVAVFAAFAAGRLVMFQQVGFGLAVSIFLDATIVRSVLVPASMKLLGDLNWYFPKWLSWLPNIGIKD